MELSQEEYVLQCALEELQVLTQKGGFAAQDVLALLRIMSVHEVVEYLDAKMSNRLQ
jgi:hypothetical protein